MYHTICKNMNNKCYKCNYDEYVLNELKRINEFIGEVEEYNYELTTKMTMLNKEGKSNLDFYYIGATLNNMLNSYFNKINIEYEVGLFEDGLIIEYEEDEYINDSLTITYHGESNPIWKDEFIKFLKTWCDRVEWL